MSEPADSSKNVVSKKPSETAFSENTNTQNVASSITSSDTLREDLVQSAVSFLSSPNIKSAETAKKVAFLRTKGLNQNEIEEAFRRVGQDPSAASSSSSSSTTTITPPASSSIPPAPLIPSRPQAPYVQQIIYKPHPNNTLPVQQLVAIAVLVGMGATGVLSGIVGIVKSLLLPTMLKVAAYRHSLHNARKSTLDKILESAKPSSTKQQIHNDDDHNDDDAIALSSKLAKQQLELSDTIARLVSSAKTRRHSLATVPLSKTTFEFRESLQTHDPAPIAVDQLRSEIRTLKSICLNRR